MKIYRYTLAVVGLALTLMGSETNAFEDDPFSITHGPYLQQLTEASVMIVWFTSRESVSRVEYGTGITTGPSHNGAACFILPRPTSTVWSMPIPQRIRF